MTISIYSLKFLRFVQNLMCFGGPKSKFKTSCLLMDPMRFENLGPSKDMIFCALMSSGGPKNLMSIDGPRKSLNDMRFWVHQKT